MIKTNPMVGVTKPKAKAEKKEVYEIHEIEQLLELLQQAPSHHRMIVKLALFLGLRRGEIIGLEWKHIDLEAGTLKVEQTWYKSKIDETKTEESERTIEIPGSLCEELKAYHAEWKKKRLQCGHRSDFLFCNENGRPLLERSVNRWLERFIKRHNLKKISLHGFRHTYTTISLEQGMNIKELSESLGHKDPDTTLKVYAHVLKSTKKASAEKMDAFIRSIDKAGSR